MTRSWGRVAAVAALSVSMAGCASSPERASARSVAVDFVTAVQSKDGARACALLTSNASDSASGATKVPCAQAVLNVDESGTDVHRVEVWGDAAQVKVGQDVLFLRRYDAGWKVSAAGCQPQPPAAYSCDVEG